MLRLVALMPSEGAGGAERVMVFLCNWFASQRFDSDVEVTLVAFTSNQEGKGSFFPIDERVRVRFLNLEGSGWSLAKLGNWKQRILALRRVIFEVNPDCALSFLETNNLTMLLAGIGCSCRVVVSERSDPRFHKLPVPVRFMRGMLYHWADRVVVQTAEIARIFKRHGWWSVSVVTNPIIVPAESAIPSLAERPRRIIGVGRLGKEKGFDLLIRAFHRLANTHPDWEVVIYGEGPERSSLEKLIMDLGLEGRVVLTGLKRDIDKVFGSAAIIAFPSLFEGFPNALGEAMAWGVPAVAFRNVSGVSDLVLDGETGRLADHGCVSSLASALEDLMGNESRRLAMGQAARRRVQEVCDVERVMNRWGEILFPSPAARKS